MAGDPARIRGAPPAIVITQVKNVLERGIGADHVAAMNVQNGFGLPGGAGRVQHVERIVRVHDFGRALGAGNGQLHQVVIPVVAAGFHVDLVAGALDDEHRFDGRATFDRLVHRLF